MPPKRRPFTPEYKEQKAREVVEKSLSVAQEAASIGVNEQTLRNWVNDYRKTLAGPDAPLGASDRARLQELEKENRELKLEREFLGKSVAFFARKYR